MASRLPTRDEVAAARRASYESIQAIIDEKKKSRQDESVEEQDDDTDEDHDLENGDRARLEALLIKSRFDDTSRRRSDLKVFLTR